jgi:hypothetical protein
MHLAHTEGTCSMIVIGDRNSHTSQSDFNINLDSVRSAVSKQWIGSQVLAHFTDHGPEHCVRIEEHLIELFALLSERLSDAETHVLACAVWTHDIGMQDSRFSFDDKPITKLTEDEYDTMRKQHAQASEEWILDVFQKSRLRPDIGLKRDDYTRLIARVARAHSNFDLADLEEKAYAYGGCLRLRLLAALLLIADEMDLDSRRVNLDDLLRINIPPESKLHWWRHHYVDAVSIEGHTPHIHMTLPRLYEGMIAQTWAAQATAGLRNQLAKKIISDTFQQAGCWLDEPKVDISFDDHEVKHLWPNELPLDTRIALKNADIALIRDSRLKDMLSLMGLNVYGVAFESYSRADSDALLAGIVKVYNTWRFVQNAHLQHLYHERDRRVGAILRESPLIPLARHFLNIRSFHQLSGRMLAQTSLNWTQPPAVPANPSDDFSWDYLCRTDGTLLFPTVESRYAARAMVNENCAANATTVERIDKVVEELSAQIVIATVLTNTALQRFNDNASYKALGLFAEQLNPDAGPLLQIASQEAVDMSSELQS